MFGADVAALSVVVVFVFFQADTLRQRKSVSKVSTGTCEMLRGGLQDFSSRRAHKKKKKASVKVSTVAQTKHASHGSSSQLLCSPTLWQA